MKTHLFFTRRHAHLAVLAMHFSYAALPAAAADIYWHGTTSVNWSNVANWSTASDATTPNPGTVPGASDDVVFNITGLNTNQDISLVGANRSANSMTFISSGTTFFRRASGDSANANGILLGAGGLTMTATSGAVTVGSDNQRINLSAANSLSLTNNSSSLLTFNRSVSSSESSGTTVITMNGSGTGGTAFVGGITDGTSGANLALIIDTTGGFTYLTGGIGNTYSGGTTLEQGVLALRSSSSLGSGTLTINGGTFGSVVTARSFDNNVTINADFQLGGVSVPSLSNQATTFNGTVDLGGATRTITLGNSATFNGEVSNGGLVIEATGNSTLTLAGNSTYIGATTISSGTLFLTGALGATDVTVEEGATIRGTGTIGGDLSFSSGAQLDLTGAALGVASTGILSVGSTITLTDFAFASITGWDWANADEGTYMLISGGNEVILAGTTPTEANPFDFGGGRLGYFQAGSLQAVIIPEPSAALLGSLGLLVVLRRRRA